MKVYYLFFALFLLFCGTVAQAQLIYNNQVSLQNVRCEQKGNQLYISMNVKGNNIDISSKQSLVLTPMIKSGSKEKALPPIVISGNNRYKADKRFVNFNGTLGYPAPDVVVKNKSSESANISYKQTIPFEPWMENAFMNIKEEIYGCASCKKTESRDVITAVQFENVKPEAKPLPNYIRPLAEAVKNRNMEGKAYLDFPAGKSVILADFRNNLQELKKIQSAINEVKNDPNAIINSVELIGYASPEGSAVANRKLSADRTDALKNYLQKEYDYKSSMFNVQAGGEDWTGLRKAIATSVLTEKDAILHIIDNVSDLDAREQKFKTLKGGVYKELMDNVYPPLRRVDYRLDYTIRAFSVEEGKEIIKTRPGQMSLNEMFLVANTYPKGSSEFNNVFDVAVRMYPDDTVANINASAIALNKGDLSSAHRFLDPFKNAPDAWNNLGVLYLLEGNYDQSREFLTKAQKNGIKEANENIKLLDAWILYQEKLKAKEKAALELKKSNE